MIVLLGAVCLFSKLTCTPVGMIGRPFDSMEACMVLKHKLDHAIGPIEWLDGDFECVEDQELI